MNDQTSVNEKPGWIAEFFYWLFNEPNGHFALLVFMLTAAAISWLCHVSKADSATKIIFGYVLAKLK